RQDRLVERIPAGLGRTTGRVTLDDVELTLLGISRSAVGELARQAHRVEGILAGELARLLRGLAGASGLGRLRDDQASLGGIAFEPVGQFRVDDLLDERLRLGLTEPC